MTNYLSLSRCTNYPLISQTMNGNVFGFHVGFWVTFSQCIRLKTWVFNQSISYFSVYLQKQKPVPICFCVNYSTIRTCLKYPSKLKGDLSSSYGTIEERQFCKMKLYDKGSNWNTPREKRVFLKTSFPNSFHYRPITLSSSCIWFALLIYSCSRCAFKHLCCAATEPLKYINFIW